MDHVTFPNRVLREAGLLSVRATDRRRADRFRAAARLGSGGSSVLARLRAGRRPGLTARIVDLFRRRDGIAEVLVGTERAQVPSRPRTEWRGHTDLDAQQLAGVLLVVRRGPRLPQFARTVDIHRKPGYDPVELHFDPATKSIPLDASLVRGSHGAPALDASQQGVLLASRRGVLESRLLRDIDVAAIVLRQFET